MFCLTEIYFPAYGADIEFIAVASGKGHGAIGHSLRVVSSDIQIIKTNHPVDHHSVVFLNTPSFDASSHSGIEVLCQIASWLKS
jgi:hypothetical protein